MKKLGLFLGILILSTAFLVGCSEENGSEDVTSSNTPFIGEYVVDMDYLEGKLDDEDVIILDARGEDDAAKGTIKNAQAVMWQQFSQMEGENSDEGWGNLLEKDEMEEALGEAGLSMDKEIIIFADGKNGWGEDGRILWTLISCGYDDVKMLNVSYTYWSENEGETTKEVKAPVTTEVSIDKIDDKFVISGEDLLAGIDSIKIVDTREIDEYAGAVKYGESRGGYIKNAINIPFSDFFTEDNALKSNDEIKKMFDDNDINIEDEVATYCTAGIRSAYEMIILSMLDYENAKNYDGSIYEWSANEDNPMEK